MFNLPQKCTDWYFISLYIYRQTFLDIVMPQSHLTPALRKLEVVNLLIITDMRNASHLGVCLHKKQFKQQT